MFEGYPGQAAEIIGDKVLEMADRLASVAKVVPGSRANCPVEIDGIDYDLVLTVAAPPSEQSA